MCQKFSWQTADRIVRRIKLLHTASLRCLNVKTKFFIISLKSANVHFLSQILFSFKKKIKFTFIWNGYVISDGFSLDVSKLAFELFATFDLADELPLEDGHVRIQIDKLEEEYFEKVGYSDDNKNMNSMTVTTVTVVT
jgi:hypothetical protein